MKQFCERQFSLFDLAHTFWIKTLRPGDWAIDATCGNGHDTLFLSEHCAGVIGLDIQPQALLNTRERCRNKNIFLFHQSHRSFPALAHLAPIRLVVYNLGYLPGGSKAVTTMTLNTLKSVENALTLILPGGLVSITSYSGHIEGQKEEEALLSFCRSLCPKTWTVVFHKWLNRNKAPSLLLIQKEFYN